jgi:hypothetical protein
MLGSKHNGVDGLQPALAVADAVLSLHLRQANLTDLTYFLYLVNRSKDTAGAAVKYGRAKT